MVLTNTMLWPSIGTRARKLGAALRYWTTSGSSRPVQLYFVTLISASPERLSPTLNVASASAGVARAPNSAARMITRLATNSSHAPMRTSLHTQFYENMAPLSAPRRRRVGRWTPAPPPPRFARSPSPVNGGGSAATSAAVRLLPCAAGEGDRRMAVEGAAEPPQTALPAARLNTVAAVSIKLFSIVSRWRSSGSSMRPATSEMPSSRAT